MSIVDCDSYFSIIFIWPVPGVQLVNTGAKKSTDKRRGFGERERERSPQAPNLFPLFSSRRCLPTERLKKVYFHLSIYTNLAKAKEDVFQSVTQRYSD